MTQRALSVNGQVSAVQAKAGAAMLVTRVRARTAVRIFFIGEAPCVVNEPNMPVATLRELCRKVSVACRCIKLLSQNGNSKGSAPVDL